MRRLVPAVAVLAVSAAAAGVAVPAHARAWDSGPGGSPTVSAEPSGTALESAPPAGAGPDGAPAGGLGGTGTAAAVPASADATAADSSPVPEAWWPLDAPVTGDAVPDASGHGNVLTLLNGPSSYTDPAVAPPLVSLGLDRDRNQWGSTDKALVNTSTQFTWSAWVRPDLTAGTAGDTMNLPVISQSGVRNTFVLQRYQDGSWMFTIPDNDTVAYSDAQLLGIQTAQRAALGAWTHVVAVYDKTGTNKAYLYVNGVLAGSQDNPPAWKADGPLLVGGREQAGSPWGSFPGLIRDVRVYQTALTAGQVTSLYNVGLREEPGQEGRWPLDDGTGTTGADLSGNHNPLTLRNGASWDKGSPATSLSLDYKDSQYADTAGMVVNTRGSYSVSVWARLAGDGPRDAPGTPPDAYAAAGAQVVVSQQMGTNSGFVVAGDLSGQWRVWLRRGGGELLSVVSGVKPAADRWYHLVYVQDKGTANTAYLYVDGTRKGTLADPPWPAPAGALQVGRQMNEGSYSAYLDGQVRDLRVYGYPLSVAQVSALYAEGKDGIGALAPQQLGVSPCQPGCAPLGLGAVTTLQRPDLTALVRARAGSKWKLEFAVARPGAATPAETGTVDGAEAGKTASWMPGTYLDNNTDWVFRVRASDEHGWGPWSYDFGFRVDVPAPEIPLITSKDFTVRHWGNPASGEIVWQSPSPEIEAYSWQLDNGPWSDWKDTTSTTLDKLSLSWHYFHVKARNHAGLESAVASFGFGVGPEPLKFPDLNGDGIADLVVSTSARLAAGEDGRLPGETGGSVLIVPGGTDGPDGAKAVLLHEGMKDLIPGPGEAGDDFGASVAYGDFTGDGHTDLAIGVPGRTVDGHEQAGEVIVLYGQQDPPYVTDEKVTVFTTASIKDLGAVESGDEFGISLAAARFRGSGYSGLAIGIPGHTVDGKARAGAVVLLKGSPDGLTTDGAQVLNASAWAGDGHGPVADARFGWSVAAEDLTAPAAADLAVLALGPGDDVTVPSGAVYIVHGEFEIDLKPILGDKGILTAAQTHVAGHLRAVIAGMFGGGDNADLVIAADARPDAAPYSGALVQVEGTGAGIDPGSARVMGLAVPRQGEDGLDDYFAGTLAAGTFPGSDTEDLALATLGAGRYAGSVTVLAGGPAGIFSLPPLTITPQQTGGTGAQYDGFGYGLAVQPADATGTMRLIITAPQQAGDPTAGSVYTADIKITGIGPELAGSSRYPAAQIRGDSLYGPAFPVAGGVIIGTDVDQSPMRARLWSAQDPVPLMSP